MSGSLRDGTRGVAHFTLTEVVVLYNPNGGEPVSICELVCDDARMGFYVVPNPSDLAQTQPVLPGMFADFLPLERRWKGTITGDLLPYIDKAVEAPSSPSTRIGIVHHYVRLFGALKMLEPHELNRQLIGLAHALDDSIRNEVSKHTSLAPKVYQLADYVEQYRILELVVEALYR